MRENNWSTEPMGVNVFHGFRYCCMPLICQKCNKQKWLPIIFSHKWDNQQ